MTLLIGGNGSIGRRYQAILRYLNKPVLVWDQEDVALPEQPFARAIVCSPTSTHYEYCKLLIAAKKPFLCEKPLSKFVNECEDLVRRARRDQVIGRVVNNYEYVLRDVPRGNMFFDYYNTGKDGVFWDCCQLIYMDPNVEIRTTSPRWHLNRGGRWIRYKELENSYIQMIKHFVNGKYDYMWSLQDGVDMTKAVLERMEREDRNRHTSTE